MNYIRLAIFVTLATVVNSASFSAADSDWMNFDPDAKCYKFLSDEFKCLVDNAEAYRKRIHENPIVDLSTCPNATSSLNDIWIRTLDYQQFGAEGLTSPKEIITALEGGSASWIVEGEMLNLNELTPTAAEEWLNSEAVTTALVEGRTVTMREGVPYRSSFIFPAEFIEKEEDLRKVRITSESGYAGFYTKWAYNTTPSPLYDVELIDEDNIEDSWQLAAIYPTIVFTSRQQVTSTVVVHEASELDCIGAVRNEAYYEKLGTTRFVIILGENFCNARYEFE